MSWRRRGFIQRVIMLFGPAPPGQAGGGRPGRLGGYIRPDAAAVIHRKFDVIVVGGGIAGTCAAIASARNGAKTALVHERSMPGGNSSSEVRLYPEVSTNHNVWCKELGILDEIHTEERAQNHEPYQEGKMTSVWDLVLYDRLVREPNLTLFLNTTMREVEMRDAAHILAIHATQMGTELEFVLEAPLFVDATGDGVLGFRAGAEHRWGMEARGEFGEAEAPEKAASRPQMGSTLFFRARDAGVPVPFRRPEWAAEFASEEDLAGRQHSRIETGYWWIEVGLPMHQIHDNEKIRHEGLRQLLGVWDHIKNRCPSREKAANYGLEFVGFWPYKREARRLIGDYILKQRDVQDPAVHEDSIACGCWYIDIHKPGGILARKRPNLKPGWESAGTIPYGIPLRSCYSKNIENLMMAGRPISTTYVAFGSTRVLRTGAAVGQGVGVAAALCSRRRCTPAALAANHSAELRQTLLRQDCFPPGTGNEDPADLARAAAVTASGEIRLQFPESDRLFALRTPAAQLFPVTSPRLASVELLLASGARGPRQLTCGLRRADFVYDFRSTRDIATASATVAPGATGYVRFDFGAAVEPDRLYWIHLPAADGISWALYSDPEDEPAKCPTGTTAAELPGPARWHPLTNNQSFCLRLTPEQRPYGPRNAVRGGNRPDRWPNIWISDMLPAWIELEWPSPVAFDTVQLTFDTDVNRHTRRALFRYPDCVKRYRIAVWRAGSWKTVVEEKDNYLRRREHAFEAVQSRRLRIDVLETNGGPSARLYEARVYLGG